MASSSRAHSRAHHSLVPSRRVISTVIQATVAPSCQPGMRPSSFTMILMVFPTNLSPWRRPDHTTRPVYAASVPITPTRQSFP